MSMTPCYLYVMKRELKKTYTYATKPSTKIKAEKLAEKEGVTLSEKIDELLEVYINRKPTTSYIDSVGLSLINGADKKKK